MMQATDKLVMQVTVCAVDDPDLYGALLRIQAPRKRASHLKALSKDGLRVRSGGLRLADSAADHRDPDADKPQQRTDINEMLAWDEEEA